MVGSCVGICVGIWVARPDKGPNREDKIGAIGIRIRRWVTFHGIALNVDPVLEHFSGIVPCGVKTQGVTSLADLGVKATMAEVDAVMEQAKKAGAVIVKAAQDTFYGGYAGYFQDPDGHLWEVAWNPQWVIKE